MLLFYIRHGQPIYDPDSLTELGQKQADALAKRLKNSNIDVIYSSTSGRAMQTAKATAKALNMDIIPLDWAHEIHAWDNMYLPTNGKKEFFKVFVSFYGARIATLVMEWLIFFIFCDLLHISRTIITFASQVIIFIANYVLSKLFVFKKKDESKSNG